VIRGLCGQLLRTCSQLCDELCACDEFYACNDLSYFQRLNVCIALLGLQKRNWMLAPVSARVKVVRGVVAVVVAVAITCDVYEGDGGAKVGVGLDFVYKGVLTPVTDHETKASEGKGKHKGEESCGKVHVSGEEVDKSITRDFRTKDFQCRESFLLADEVEGEVDPDKEEEAADVLKEVEDRVSLVANCRGEVIWPISFDMVVLHMMPKI